MNNLIANRKLTGFSALVLAVAVGATVPASQAQGQAPKAIANIPFDFQVGSEHLQAGRYTIGMDSGHIIRLAGAKATNMALTRVEMNGAKSGRGKLVFDKYGSRYFLREVWQANSTEHQVIPRSKAEKRQQNALNDTERNGTEVALLEPLN